LLPGAFSLPPTAFKDTLLTVCYGVVVFTIIVQGLTMSGSSSGYSGRGRRTDKSRSAQPVLDRKAGNPAKLGFIVGDEHGRNIGPLN
jgi:hypothetical protein